MEDVEEAPGDRLPTLLEVPTLDVVALVGVLAKAPAPLAHACMTRLALLVQRPGMDATAEGAGALEAVVTAMRAHAAVPELQAAGCEVIALVCLSCDENDPGAMQRHQRALQAGALQTVVAGLTSHVATNDPTGDLLTRGCMALTVLTANNTTLRAQAVALGADVGWLPST